MHEVLASGPALALGEPAPALGFEQIIIAGGDEDIDPEEMLEWISPLLAGIPGGRWMSCQIELLPGHQVLAHVRHGGCDAMLSLAFDARSAEARLILDQLPGAPSFALVLPNDFTSQAAMLLDGIARWLSIHELSEQSLAPLVRLLGQFQSKIAA